MKTSGVRKDATSAKDKDVSASIFFAVLASWRENWLDRGRRPRGGTSRFVDVHRQGDKWQAALKYRGEYFYGGRFDDEVEAARARDRLAYQLNGERAYINLPEDLPRWLRRKHKRATTCNTRMVE